ncbi:MAG: hypothetical protein HC889_14535 [Synechococcaceae cyanobacterium SM1_2_3]|nr:hypothetical protein [Synechococcaceae cyanobacterium SM1_2_3]
MVEVALCVEAAGHPDDQILAATIVTLGHGLGLKVIAEGVGPMSSGGFCSTRAAIWPRATGSADRCPPPSSARGRNGRRC